MTLTVKEIPWVLKPVFELVSYLLAAMMYLHLSMMRTTTRIHYQGGESLNAAGNHTLCVWHEDLSLFFISHRYFYQPNIWMSYPAWYIRPIHILKGWMGIRELAFGGSGLDGKKAWGQVVEGLSKGWSSFISPDGPSGPLKVLKDGVLSMSLASGAPVIPIFFDVSHEWRIPTWDKKRYPLPFSKITVIYGAPLYVHAENYDEARTYLSNFMDSGPSGAGPAPSTLRTVKS